MGKFKLYRRECHNTTLICLEQDYLVKELGISDKLYQLSEIKKIKEWIQLQLINIDFMNKNASQIFQSEDYQMIEYISCNVSPSHLTLSLDANFYHFFTYFFQNRQESWSNRLDYAIQLVRVSLHFNEKNYWIQNLKAENIYVYTDDNKEKKIQLEMLSVYQMLKIKTNLNMIKEELCVDLNPNESSGHSFEGHPPELRVLCRMDLSNVPPEVQESLEKYEIWNLGKIIAGLFFVGNHLLYHKAHVLK